MRRSSSLALVIGLALAALAGSASAQEVAPLPAKLPIEPPAPAAGGKISLEEAIRRAVTRNPTAEVAEQEIRRAEALSRQARAGWLPILSANATYTRLDNDRELSGRIILSANQLHGNVTLNVPLVAPRQWVAWSRSKDNIAVAERAGLDARRSVAVAAARAYLTVLAQHRVLDASQKALRNAKAHEDYATTRFQGGIGNRLDAARAAQERATASTRVTTQLIGLNRARESLGVIVGEERALDAAAVPDLPTPASVEAALGEASQRRTDVALERQRVETTRKAVRDSWVDYLPVLSGNAQPFYQNPPTFTQPLTGWQAQLVLSLPLYDGGARYALADEREALEAQARSRLEGLLRQARAEVRIAFDVMRRADAALLEAREASRFANEALELARMAYQAGATSNIEVLDAERQVGLTDTTTALAEDTARQARLDLLVACGRFP
jgi:outer membrane protein